MSGGLELVLLGLGLLALLAALGSAPALELTPGLAARAALSPVFGLALAAALLTTASAVIDMRTAAFAVLAPAAAASLGWTAMAVWRRGGAGRPSAEIAIPLALALGGFGLAALPGILHGSAGPVSLGNFDAFLYIPGSLWIQDHTLADGIAPLAAKLDLTLGTGHSLVDCGCRLGVASLQGATTELGGAEPDQTSLPLLAALFALLPPAIWFAARNLGANMPGAAFGAAFGLSPALLLLVADSTLANLAGLVGVAPLVVVAVLAWQRREPRLIAAGALLGAGVVALYPEFTVSFAAIAGLGLLAALVSARRRGAPPLAHTWDSARPVAALAAGSVLLAPVAAFQGADYLRLLGLQGFGVELPRFLTPESLGSWAFGVQHLYELQRFGDLSFAKAALAICLPLLLVAALVAVLVDCWRQGPRAGLPGPAQAFAVGAPLLAAGTLAIYSYLRYDDCEYCLWKSLTFGLPFLGLGLALAADRGLRLAAGRGRGWLLALLAAAALPLAALGRADVELTRAQYEAPSYLSEAERGLSAAIEAADPGPVLLEGADATAAPLWDLPEAYYLIRSAPGTRISMDPGSPFARTFAIDLEVPARPPFYVSGYSHVVTTYPGIASGRRLLSRSGQYALMRRAPIDVAVMRPGWAVDTGEGAAAIPWLQGPFELWISNRRPLRRASLELGLVGPVARAAGPELQLGERRLQASFAPATATRPARTCVALPLTAGRTVLEGAPPAGLADLAGTFPAHPVLNIGVGSNLDPRLRPTESDPLPPPPKLLGLASLRIRPGGCRP